MKALFTVLLILFIAMPARARQAPVHVEERFSGLTQEVCLEGLQQASPNSRAFRCRESFYDPAWFKQVVGVKERVWQGANCKATMSFSGSQSMLTVAPMGRGEWKLEELSHLYYRLFQGFSQTSKRLESGLLSY